jgi:oxidoreductase
LQSPHFTRVGEYGRRITEEKDLATGKEKLEQKVIDFEKLEEGAWKNAKWDVVFVTYVQTS